MEQAAPTRHFISFRANPTSIGTENTTVAITGRFRIEIMLAPDKVESRNFLTVVILRGLAWRLSCGASHSE